MGMSFQSVFVSFVHSNRVKSREINQKLELEQPKNVFFSMETYTEVPAVYRYTWLTNEDIGIQWKIWQSFKCIEPINLWMLDGNQTAIEQKIFSNMELPLIILHGFIVHNNSYNGIFYV